MNFKDKKAIIIIALVLALVFTLVAQGSKSRKFDKILDAYEHNAINTYNYLMSKTNYKPAIETIEKLYDTESIDDKMLISISDSFSEIIDHLLQLNALRGYSEKDEMLKEQKNKVRGFSYVLLYKEQDTSYETIYNIYTGFENLLMDMYQNGIKEEDKAKVLEIITNIKQVEGTIKSSVNRNINPNDLKELRGEFKRIEPLLEKIEKVFGE